MASQLIWRLEEGYSRFIEGSRVELRLKQGPLGESLEISPKGLVNRSQPIELLFQAARSFAGADPAGLAWRLRPEAATRAHVPPVQQRLVPTLHAGMHQGRQRQRSPQRPSHALAREGLDIPRGVAHQEETQGQDRLFGLLSGDRRPTSGEILVGGGRKRFLSPYDAVKEGVVLVPGDRLLALLPSLPVRQNLAVTLFSRLRRWLRLPADEQERVDGAVVGDA